MRQMGTGMGRSIHAGSAAGGTRVDWVDYAKGFCIVFVVMMHSTLGVENAAGQEGWLHVAVAFAKPFRMPDFFLISGLFLAQVIGRDWRTYLDRKVVHFVYFYLLWTAIQFAVKAPVFVHEHGPLSTLWLYAESFWEPFSTLWFIYLLPIFFVATKLAHSLRIPPLLVWLVAAALEMAHVHTGALAGLAIWGVINGLLVFNGFSELPLISLGLGLAGAAAVVSVSVLLAKSDLASPLRYCGRNSIVIYLAFFLPMAASRAVLLKTGWIADIGTISVIVTVVGVLGSLAWFWAVRWTFLRFLFERPEAFWLAPKKRLVLQPA